MNGALDNVYSTTIDASEVNSLLNEMREQHGMEVGGEMDKVNNNSLSAAQKNDVDDMQKKLD